MGDLLDRFMSFDKMMGARLIKALYFLGLAIIIVGTLLRMAQSLGWLFSSPFNALAGFVLAPIAGAIAILFWRFVCELYILLFRMSDDLREIRDAKLLEKSD